MCPGDNVSFICTVSGSDGLLLIWLNPDNKEDLEFYQVNDTNIQNDNAVGEFTTKLVEARNDTIISTATINELNLADIMYAGISCLDGFGTCNNQTLYVADSGRKYK